MTKTTIQLEKSTVTLLKQHKRFSGESYDEVINTLLGVVQEMKKHNQYDKYLHTIQQPKMQELWQNTEDEEWDRV